VAPKALQALIVLLASERWLNKKFDADIENEFFEKGHILVDADKFVIKDFILE
jgi:hypothetical protein